MYICNDSCEESSLCEMFNVLENEYVCPFSFTDSEMKALSVTPADACTCPMREKGAVDCSRYDGDGRCLFKVLLNLFVKGGVDAEE